MSYKNEQCDNPDKIVLSLPAGRYQSVNDGATYELMCG